MPSPFPGMNPYLENPELWPEVHSRSIIAIADAIAPQLRPKYRVAVEKRVYQHLKPTLQCGKPKENLLTKSKLDLLNLEVGIGSVKTSVNGRVLQIFL